MTKDILGHRVETVSLTAFPAVAGVALVPRGRAVRSVRRKPTCGHSWSVPQGHRRSVSHRNGKHSLFILPPYVEDHYRFMV